MMCGSLTFRGRSTHVCRFCLCWVICHIRVEFKFKMGIAESCLYSLHNLVSRVRSSAFGTPPPWIRSVHGAEVWAFFAAASRACGPISYRTDCLEVYRAFRRGRLWATAAARPLARAWHLIFACLDDVDAPEDHVDLAWMPAHTAQHAIGAAELSNGQLLTKADRDGNAAADLLAKRGAQLHRVPAGVRKELARAHAAAEHCARLPGGSHERGECA